MPITTISNHDEKIRAEMWLIYIPLQEIWPVLAFSYCLGNVIDIATFTKTILELKVSFEVRHSSHSLMQESSLKRT
ncbi:MAG: hypothetical protein JEY71_06440 [Sphaerochaeta sp.]|nr:hypothetical protein [Sphaerochaeta sp.]